jgi:diguanylate cyclase
MIPTLPKTPRRQKTLLSVLRRAHVNIIIAAVTLVGVSLTTTGAIALMAYADDSLRLVARAIAYNAEAATVFEDHLAALDALGSVAASGDIASASITDRHGQILAWWRSPENGIFDTLARFSAVLLQQKSVMMPIAHDGAVIGVVRVSGNGQNLFSYVIVGFLGILLSQALIVASAVLLSRRMMDEIVGPLRTFTRVAHAVRENRDFGRRMQGSQIAELNSLAQDFNALLYELSVWQGNIESEQASLRYRANHDSLTGLCNRALFEDRLLQELAKADLCCKKIALFMIDCDSFKEINDRFGHAAGDAVLIRISQRLKERLGPGDLAARLGGDEFALLVTFSDQDASASGIAASIKASMLAPITLSGGEQIMASLSIGVAMYPEHASGASELLHQADLAMYQSKFTARQQNDTSLAEEE